MNKKIEEFAKKSDIAAFLTNGSVVSPWREDTDIRDHVEEFAELIVKECIYICENCSVGFDIEQWRTSTKKEMTALTAMALAEKIKRHFGLSDDNEDIRSYIL